MSIGIPCPRCGDRSIQTVRTAWYLYGLLLFASWGQTRFVGCLSCTRRQVLETFAKTMLMGWWCVPWGLGTPLVLGQNLFAAFRGPDRAALRALLAEQGLDLDELNSDQQGRSRGQQRLRASLLFVLHEIIWADGVADVREIDTSLRIASRLLGEPTDAFRETLTQQTPPEDPVLSLLPMDARPVLLRAAASVAGADQHIDPTEIDTLRVLGERLQLNQGTIDAIVNALHTDEVSQRERRNMIALATEVIGLGPEASAPELQAQYRSLLLQAMGDKQEPAQAAAVAERLSWAYEVLHSDLTPG